MDLDDLSDKLCMGCMKVREEAGVCPYCGFDEENYETAPHHLPLRAILTGKYYIGRALGEGGFGITYAGWDLNLEFKIAIKEFYPSGFATRDCTTSRTITPFTGERGDFSIKGVISSLKRQGGFQNFIRYPASFR